MAEIIELGIVGIKNCGEYNAETRYEKLNVVTYQGSSYCALEETLGNLPTDTEYWQLYASKGDPAYFDNVASMKSSTNLVNGSYAKTLGYYIKNDGGEALYKIRTITNNDVIDEMFILSMSNENLIAELIISSPLNIKQIGAKGNGTNNDTPYFSAFINSSLINTLYIPNGTYNVETLKLKNGKKFIGEDLKETILSITGSGYGIELERGIVSNTLIHNLTLNNSSSATVGMFLMSKKDSNGQGGLWDSNIDNVKIIGFNYGLIFGGGLKETGETNTPDTPNQHDNIHKLFISDFTTNGAWFCGRCDCLKVTDSVLGDTLIDALENVPTGFLTGDLTNNILFENTQFGHISTNYGIKIVRGDIALTNCWSEEVSKAIWIRSASKVVINNYLFERCGINQENNGYLLNIDSTTAKVTLNNYRLTGNTPNNQIVGNGKNKLFGEFPNNYTSTTSNTGDNVEIITVTDNSISTNTKFIIINTNSTINNISSNFSAGDLIYLRGIHNDGFTLGNTGNISNIVTIPQYGYVILFYTGGKWYPIGGKCTIS